MANKPKHTKRQDSDVVAANEIYEAGKRVAESEVARLKEYADAAPLDHQAIGEIRMAEFFRAQGELATLMVLYRMKVSKDYKKRGMTWEQLCEAVGKPVRSVDRLIADIKPVCEVVFGHLATFSGVQVHKIKYLGSAVSAKMAEIKDECLHYLDEKIPLTPEHHEEVQALLDKIAFDFKTRAEEAEGDLRAAKRNLRDRDADIEKKNKLLDKYEGKARHKDLTPEEDGFLSFLDTQRITFDGYMLTVEPGKLDEIQGGPENGVTPRMRASYLELLGYMRRQIVAAYDTATEIHGADMALEGETWKPGK
jgi:hypothetical protein